MTTCAICGGPCGGSEHTRNPFCVDCVGINFRDNAVERWAILMDTEAYTPQQVARERYQAARALAAGHAGDLET
jgi:endogenous inhibitor of DNA gyrase (YacG/DUF329 family)